MAWNQPGGPDNKDPWNPNKNRPQGGSDLDKLVRMLQDKLSGLFGGKGGKGGKGVSGMGLAGPAAILLFGLLVLVIWAFTGVYTLDQAENAYILRFGKMNRLVTTPGLGFHFPYPIETVEKVNIRKVRLLQVGYREDPSIGAKRKVDEEALMLTEDENIIDIEFLVKYKVIDAEKYLFRVRNPGNTISQATESAVREVVGHSKLDYVFLNRAKIQEEVRIVLSKLLENYDIGVDITGIEMQNAKPPDEVKEAFNDAIKAREDKERFIETANAYKKDLIPRAKGEAARMKNEAEGHKQSVIKRAAGERYRFLKIAREYAKAPRVTRTRLYLDTMQRVLSKTTKIYIDQKKGSNLLYLPLDKLLSRQEEANNAGSSASNKSPEGSTGREGDGRAPRVDDSRLR
ncbi:MAG TPA: FtsH protease activity modulator HflK [Acidiferrobacteraceae bacterium]|nr:FtsH protease activity modulator HflK [Acidiferrobacteraceae bacterium]HEX19244.1 FtsH protease activity modulator HflK [Acidiferrobacteraceae bacterium]